VAGPVVPIYSRVLRRRWRRITCFAVSCRRRRCCTRLLSTSRMTASLLSGSSSVSGTRTLLLAPSSPDQAASMQSPALPPASYLHRPHNTRCSSCPFACASTRPVSSSSAASNAVMTSPPLPKPAAPPESPALATPRPLPSFARCLLALVPSQLILPSLNRPLLLLITCSRPATQTAPSSLLCCTQRPDQPASRICIRFCKFARASQYASS